MHTSLMPRSFYVNILKETQNSSLPKGTQKRSNIACRHTSLFNVNCLIETLDLITMCSNEQSYKIVRLIECTIDFGLKVLLML